MTRLEIDHSVLIMAEQAEQQIHTGEHKRIVALAVDESEHSVNALKCKSIFSLFTF